MHCFLIAAITIDGFIARETSQISTAWTSAEDKKWFNQRTKEAGVIVMGSSTYDTIGRPLPGRLNIVYSSRADQLNAQSLPDNLLYTKLEPAELLQSLEKENYSEVAICGGSSIYTTFMKSGKIDTLYLTLEPAVFGKGVGLFNDQIDAQLTLQNVLNLSEQTKVFEYRVTK